MTFLRKKTLNQCTIYVTNCAIEMVHQVYHKLIIVVAVMKYTIRMIMIVMKLETGKQIMITVQDAPTIIKVVNHSRTIRTITRVRVTADWCSMSIPYIYWFCAIR